jgi:hypothetical protein
MAAIFLWLGMILAISFVQASQRSRVPRDAPQPEPGIGRLVFRTLNVFEYLCAVIAAVALFPHETPVALNIALVVTGAALLAQTILVRPLLSRRTAALLDGGEAEQRSGAYYTYLALEAVKIVALVWTAVLLIDGW